MKTTLTDRGVRALKPAEPGKRYVQLDITVPGLGVRVTPKGHKTYIVASRLNGTSLKLELGEVGTMSLLEAREKARRWLQAMKAGTDPRLEEARAKADTFASVAEQYILRKTKTQRRAKMSEREIRVDLIKPLGSRPLASITRRDVVDLIERIVDRPAPGAARIALSHLTTIFNWAIARNIYGIEHSPCDRIDVKLLIGEKRPRLRVLTDVELRSLWNACDEIGYPFGPLVKLLMLTGCRLGEVAGARWTEFGDNVWTIPAERFKANAQHIVPLTDDMKTVLASLPRFDGNYLFSRMGKKPTNFSKARQAFDKAMKVRAVSVDDDERPADQWTYHDIRRTVRTRLSALRIPEQVAELVIGHDKKGLVRVYNQHAFREEIKEALQAWNNLLRSIVDRSPPNIIPLIVKAS